jgi:hypothetical protein
MVIKFILSILNVTVSRIDFKKNLKIKLSKIKFKYFIFETLILFNHEKLL